MKFSPRVIFLYISGFILMMAVYATTIVEQREMYEDKLAERYSAYTAWETSVDYPMVVVEVPNEAELIAQSCIKQIGTDHEQECFGYNVTYVLQVLTHEAGCDEQLAKACTQALMNDCIRENGKYTPEQIMHEHNYATPYTWVSWEAKQAFIDIFIYGSTYEPVGKATMFYQPSATEGTPSHESYTHIWTADSGVKFFEQ